MSSKVVMRLFMVFCLTASLPWVGGAESSGSITGVVKDASGKPVAGATVKVRNSDRGITVTVTVFSRAQGRYSATNLLPGRYTVQGVGGGFQSDSSTAVEVSATHPVVVVDLALTQDFHDTLTGSQAAELVPDEKWRRILIEACTDCHHTLNRVVPRRATRDEWMTSIEKMRHNPYGYYRSLVVTDQRRDEIVDYLAKAFGPDTPPLDVKRYLPKTGVTGEVAKATITEYNLPPGATPHDVAVDSQGIAWVIEGGLGFIGAVDPRAQTYTRIQVPGGKSMLNSLGVDPQDRPWFDARLHGELVRYDPKTQTFARYPFPKPPQGTPSTNTIRFHPDGTVWMSQLGGNQVLRFDPTTEKFTEYPVPSGKLGMVSVYGMAIDKSQKVWFTERLLSNKVGVVDPNTGEVTEFDVPTPLAVPRRMSADADGNLWFGEYGGVGKLAMIDYRTGKITEYPTPTKYSGAYSVDIDKKHNLIWVNEMMADKIARFDPRTKTFVEYPLPTRDSSVRRIELDPNRPTRVWYTGFYADTVGYLEVIE